jgi:hypothetical protein
MVNEFAVKDYLGVVIQSGDIVVYPVRQGSAMWLQHLVVSHIEVIRANKPVFKVCGTNSVGRTVKIDHAERCVIVKERTKNVEV